MLSLYVLCTDESQCLKKRNTTSTIKCQKGVKEGQNGEGCVKKNEEVDCIFVPSVGGSCDWCMQLPATWLRPSLPVGRIE